MPKVLLIGFTTAVTRYQWDHNLSVNTAKWITKPEQLRGYKDIKVILLDGYERSNDYLEVAREAERLGFKIEREK